MPNTLAIDDADDLSELCQDLERTFAVRFTNAEATACQTVGDLFDLASKYRPPQSGPAPADLVRHRLLDAQFSARDEINLTQSPRRTLAALTRRTGLRMPPCQRARPGQIGLALVPASFLWLLGSAVLAPAWWWPAPLLSAFGVILLRQDPGRLPLTSTTLAGLAAVIANLNLGALHQSGAAIDDDAIWAAILENLAPFTTLPKSDTHPTTRITSKAR